MKPFQNVENLNPGRSVFDLSHQKLLSCDMGELIPILCEEMIPGDHFKMANEMIIRMNPLVAPIMHEINATVHYFFVPYRILDPDWEKFITGDTLGDDATVLPRWIPTNVNQIPVGSLWDHLGFPPGIIPTDRCPMDYTRRSYIKIFNDFYRDQTLQTELDITDLANSNILYRNWEKDYFTSALLWQQRGTAPSLPISGSTSAVFGDVNQWVVNTITTNAIGGDANGGTGKMQAGGNTGRDNALAYFQNNTVDLSVASTFDIADLRLAFQIQRFMERNARSGVRYTEFLKAHFGTSPRDDRLQRAEYVGGSKMPVITSEVLQTSSTDAVSPQGNMAGHGISVSDSYCGSYRAQEFGIMMAILSVMPKPMYSQGINRQFLRFTRYDFPFPEFANLSEQAIERCELFVSAVANENKTVFGYQGRYDECRYKPNMFAGLMRTTTAGLAHWHLGRIFSTAPALNETFIKCVPDKRIFAVTTQPGLIIHVGHKIRAVRPLPISPEPGLIDHH
nr:MAG: major capsid protein [Microvirus sp.]